MLTKATSTADKTRTPAPMESGYFPTAQGRPDNDVASSILSLQGDRRRALELTRTLEGFADAVEQGRPALSADLVSIAWLFGTFVLGREREREEYILLPWLLRHCRNIGVDVLHDIRQRRQLQTYLVKVLQGVEARRRRWPEDTRRRVAATLRELAGTERALLEYQALELLPAVSLFVDGKEIGSLADQLALFDAAPHHRSVLSASLRVLRELAARYRPEERSFRRLGLRRGREHRSAPAVVLGSHR